MLTWNPNYTYLVIDGIIGAGKTELTRKIVKTNNWKSFFEPANPDTNPFLAEFYHVLSNGHTKSKIPLLMQLYMLNQRYRDHMKIAHGGYSVVQDRSIWGDHVFAKMLVEDGFIDKVDYQELYLKLLENMSINLVPPSIVLYLKVSPETALKRIKKRGREFEKNISLEYLTRLDNEYEKWLAQMQNYSLIYRLPYDNFPLNQETINHVLYIIETLHRDNQSRKLIKHIV